MIGQTISHLPTGEKSRRTLRLSLLQSPTRFFQSLRVESWYVDDVHITPRPEEEAAK